MRSSPAAVTQTCFRKHVCPKLFPRKQLPSAFRAQVFSVVVQTNYSDCKVSISLFCCTIILFLFLRSHLAKKAQPVLSPKDQVFPTKISWCCSIHKVVSKVPKMACKLDLNSSLPLSGIYCGITRSRKVKVSVQQRKDTCLAPNWSHS